MLPNENEPHYWLAWLLVSLSWLAVPSPVVAQRLQPPVPVVAPQGRGVEGSAMVDQAILRLASYETISASLRQRINLYGRRLVGSGTYRQMNTAKDLLFRTELKVSVGDTLATLLQGCDGRHLWTYRVLPGENIDEPIQTTLTRVDINRARRGNPNINAFAIGGLPGLLRQSREQFDFRNVARTMLHGVPVWQVVGSRKGEDPDDFEHTADRVVVMLGVDDLFPYRMELHKVLNESTGSYRTIIAIELFELDANSKIDPQLFIFPPGAVPVQDVTEQFMSARGAVDLR